MMDPVIPGGERTVRNGAQAAAPLSVDTSVPPPGTLINTAVTTTSDTPRPVMATGLARAR